MPSIRMDKRNSNYLFNMMMPAFEKTQSIARRDIGMGSIPKP